MQFSEEGWFKSTRSNDQGLCVEVNYGDGTGVGVRHSKDVGGDNILVFTNDEWDAFNAGAVAGEFNRLPI